MFRLFLLLVLPAMVLLPSCGGSPQTTPQAEKAGTNQQIFQVKGVVMEVKPREKTVQIRHEEVPGYMPAMTMPFEVKNTNELAGLEPGDAVSFRMIVTAKDGWIDQIQKLTPLKTNSLPTTGPLRLVRDVEPLKPGDLLPEY